MPYSLRDSNLLIETALNVTTTQNSPSFNVAGSRGYSVLVEIVDNGGAIGVISLRAGLTIDKMIEIVNSPQQLDFTGSEQAMLFNVVDPFFNISDVLITLSAGSVDYTVSITNTGSQP